jgi:16S rRNA (guanine966-N2)-methyltransferase
MRIVAGKYKAKRLFAPKDIAVRPTLERTREALFSILYSKGIDFNNTRVLDVFAGTGAFGFEALSRGAQKVTFIDKDTQIVQKNAALFEAEKNKISIIKANVSVLPYMPEKYNLLFMDAPYDKGLTEVAIESLLKRDLIDDNALCLIETQKDETLNLPNNFEFFDERVYGIAKIRFFIYKK